MNTSGMILGALTLVSSCFGQSLEPPVWSTPRAETGEQLADDLDKYLHMLESRGLSGVILLTKDGKDLMHKAYGFADREEKRKMTVDTGSCIGSIVKPITKAAIVKLESEGKLRLEDTLPTFFADVPHDKAGITLQQVIDHKAGLPDIFGDDYEAATKEWVIEQAMKAPLIATPGEKVEYSNCGYSLLGAIIEKVAGMPYEQYVHSQLFAPAGTPRIGYLKPGWKSAELAVGYHEGKRWGTSLDHPWMEDGPSWNLRCNGGMLSTVRDLHRFFDALLGGRVLSSEGTRRYLELGVRKHASGKRFFGSIGGNGVTNAIYVNLVDDKLVFVMFTNVDQFPAEDVFQAVKARIFGFLP